MTQRYSVLNAPALSRVEFSFNAGVYNFEIVHKGVYKKIDKDITKIMWIPESAPIATAHLIISTAVHVRKNSLLF